MSLLSLTFSKTCLFWGQHEVNQSSQYEVNPSLPVVIHFYRRLLVCLVLVGLSSLPKLDWGLDQRCQPPIFSPDICAKSESNPKCLRKSLHQTNPKRRVFAIKPALRQKRVFSTKPFSWQKRVFVKLQLGHVIIGMIPATPSMHENHAFDHKKIGNIEFKK